MDSKITELSELTSVATTDVVPIVDDPSGTPVTKKITVDNLTAGSIKNTLVAAKGDLITASANDTPAILSVGANGQVPMADSNQTTGIKWHDPMTSMARQAIINGNFDVWQRGTSFTASGYTADRFVCGITGSSATITRQTFTLGQTDVPKEPKYYIRSVNTTSAGAGNNVYIAQRIESVRTFAGQTVTLSFYAKADANKNMAIEFKQNFGSGGSPSAEVLNIGSQKLALTTSWVKQTVTVAIPSISGKTVGTTDDGYLMIYLWMDAGSNFDVRTNNLGQQSGTFEFSEVQLCAGDVALPFMPKSFEEELRACQRYCQVIVSQSVYNNIGVGYASSTTNANFVVFLKTQMRIVPTLTATAGDFSYYDGVGKAALTGLSLDTGQSGIDAVMLSGGVASGLTQYRPYILMSNNSTGKLMVFSSEL